MAAFPPVAWDLVTFFSVGECFKIVSNDVCCNIFGHKIDNINSNIIVIFDVAEENFVITAIGSEATTDVVDFKSIWSFFLIEEPAISLSFIVLAFALPKVLKDIVGFFNNLPDWFISVNLKLVHFDMGSLNQPCFSS